MLVKYLVPHFDKDKRLCPEGTVADVLAKDLSPWMIPVDATAVAEMDKKFKKDKTGVQYKRGTL